MPSVLGRTLSLSARAGTLATPASRVGECYAMVALAFCFYVAAYLLGIAGVLVGYSDAVTVRVREKHEALRCA